VEVILSKSRVGTHAFPECREIWEEIDAASQEQTVQIASVAWNTQGHEIDDSVPAKLLRKLDSRGIIEQDDGKWHFALAKMIFYLRAIDLIGSLALHSRQSEEVLRELEQFIDSARDDSINSFKDYRQVVSFVLAELVNEHSRKDVLESAISEDIQEQQFWCFYDLICGSLPILDVGVQKLAKILKAAERRAKGDLAGGRAYAAVEHLGRLRPDFAFQLIDHLVESPDKISAGFLERLLTGIAKSSPENFDVAKARCEAWLESKEESICQAGICCSQNLILDSNLDPEELLSRFDSLSANPDDVRFTLAIAVATLGAHLEERSEDCLDMLQRLKVAGPLDGVTYGIAYALSRVKDDIAIGYKVTCLSLLEDVPAKNKGAVQRIRRVLHPIIDSHPEEVWKYLQRWSVSHEPGEPIAQHDMFLHTIQGVYRHNPDFGRSVLTRWFSAPDLRLVEESRLIIAELEVCAFDAEMISSMPTLVIIYITEKLLVGHFEPSQLMRLFHSILRNTSKIEELTDYFSGVLGYLAWNYPGNVKEFFEQVFDEEDTSTSSTLLQETLQQLEAYQARRKDVFVPELSPSNRRVEKYRELENKRMQIAQEAVFDDDRFPLQKLMSQVAIGRGDRTFHMNVFHPDSSQRRTFTKDRGFSQFSESMELPRGEIIDPERELWRRIQRLNLKQRELQEDERT
jgi:hypothetical protein